MRFRISSAASEDIVTTSVYRHNQFSNSVHVYTIAKRARKTSLKFFAEERAGVGVHDRVTFSLDLFAEFVGFFEVFLAACVFARRREFLDAFGDSIHFFRKFS